MMDCSLSFSNKNCRLSLLNDPLKMFMQTIDQVNSVDKDYELRIAKHRISELDDSNMLVQSINYSAKEL